MSEVAYFAAGCFWGVQYYFEQIPEVISTEAGYTGGHAENPSYEMVCTHTTGHAEAVKVEFDPKKISYEKLLQHFFRMHDPTQLNRQGPDIGDSYRSTIFYSSKSQKDSAEKTIKELNSKQYDGRVVTSLEKFKKWWPAEDYHQKFTQRTGRGMCHVAYEPI